MLVAALGLLFALIRPTPAIGSDSEEASIATSNTKSGATIISDSAMFVVATSIPSKLVIKPPKPRRWYMNNLGQCSCVEYVKARLGIVGTLGNAWSIKPTARTPEIGSIILFNAHVGVVTGYDGYYVTYDDYNWIGCTERRGVEVYAGDETIRGYVNTI